MEITLREINAFVKGELEGDPDKKIKEPTPFENTHADAITYAASPGFLNKLDLISAGAVLVPVDFKATTKTNLIRTSNPYVAFARIMQWFYPSPDPFAFGSISSQAVIGSDFTCGDSILIKPFVYIGNHVTIGSRVLIHAQVVIEDCVVIGDDVEIAPHVSILKNCCIGSRVKINAGTVIGSDGFGFAPDGEKYHKIPHRGIVHIEDDVEIGAGNTIDRASFEKTLICQGVKTDNLVHIAHNVRIGANTVIAGQAGIAGSTTIGKNVILAGQSGIAGHLELGDRVTVGPKAGVTRSIKAGLTMSGIPEMPHKLWLRVQQIIPQLPEIKKKLNQLKNKENIK